MIDKIYAEKEIIAQNWGYPCLKWISQQKCTMNE